MTRKREAGGGRRNQRMRFYEHNFTFLSLGRIPSTKFSSVKLQPHLPQSTKPPRTTLLRP